MAASPPTERRSAMKIRTIVAASIGAAILLFATAPTGAQNGSGVIMSGLDNPRGLTFVRTGDDDGGFAVYVAEAGKGGVGPCAIIRGENQCAGATGAVSRYWRGKQERVVTGLPSYAPSGGGGATGPHDVSFADHRGFVVTGLGGDPALMRATFGAHFGWTARFRPNGNVSFATDISTFEQQANPGGGPIDSNPYGLLEGAGGRIVAEAGGNALLRVAANGDISTIAVFESRAQGRSTDAVPTSVAFRRGAYYVGELTGGPFDTGVARIYRVVPGQAPVVYLGGFTSIIDIDFDRRGNLYVLQIASGAGLSPPGVLIRVARNGTRTIVPTPPLFFPSSVGIGPDGDAYISNCGVCAGGGEVIRVDVGGPPDGDDD
jgi:hypothetical protein